MERRVTKESSYAIKWKSIFTEGKEERRDSGEAGNNTKGIIA